jgi:hypothetical protein
MFVKQKIQKPGSTLTKIPNMKTPSIGSFFMEFFRFSTHQEHNGSTEAQVN